MLQIFVQMFRPWILQMNTKGYNIIILLSMHELKHLQIRAVFLNYFSQTPLQEPSDSFYRPPIILNDGIDTN